MRELYNNNTTPQMLDRGGHLTFTILNISEHLFNMLSIGVNRYPRLRDTLAPHCCHILDTIEPHLLRERASALRCVAVCCVKVSRFVTLRHKANHVLQVSFEYAHMRYKHKQTESENKP